MIAEKQTEKIERQGEQGRQTDRHRITHSKQWTKTEANKSTTTIKRRESFTRARAHKEKEIQKKEKERAHTKHLQRARQAATDNHKQQQETYLQTKNKQGAYFAVAALKSKR